MLASFNPSLARSRRVPVALNNYCSSLLLALIVNFSISAVGVLLINALLIVPAATASNSRREHAANVPAHARASACSPASPGWW